MYIYHYKTYTHVKHVDTEPYNPLHLIGLLGKVFSQKGKRRQFVYSLTSEARLNICSNRPQTNVEFLYIKVERGQRT